MLLNLCCLVGVGVLLFHAECIKGDVNNETRYLTENLFAGLNVDPFLLDEGVTKRSIRFIDTQIENYMKLKETQEDVSKRSMNRRSVHAEDGHSLKGSNTGVHVFDGFIPLDIIKPEFARDLQLFEQNNSWYAAALEARQSQNFLVLYKYEGDAFSEIKRLSATNTSILGVLPSRTFTLVVLCNYKKGERQTAIFKFDLKQQKFVRVQRLDTSFVFDVAIWEYHHETFLAVAQRDRLKTNIEIFKWLGGHFDMFDQISTDESKSLSPFSIGRHLFLAVAVHASGETNTFSEIYKYDLDDGVFVLQQRISTKAAAVDVKYFQIAQRDAKEHFLVVANSNEEDVANYNVVYKYVDDYFIPLQALKCNGVLQWLPAGGSSGEFVLLANSKYEGIKAFTYDGWRFGESPISYTPNDFDRGIASMHSYVLQGRLVLVIANRNNDGESASIFELKFLPSDTWTVQDELLSWCEEKIAEIKIPDEEEIVRAVEQAPTADKGELQFSQTVTFDDVTVKSLRIMEPDDIDGEDYPELSDIAKLIAVNDQLRELEDLEKTINSILAFDPNFLEGDVHADNVIITEDAFLDSLTAESINTIHVMDFLQNLIDISEDLTINRQVIMENVRVENPIHPEYINGKKSEDLLHASDDANLGDVSVVGNVILVEGVTPQGTLNGLEFNEYSILMKEGDQTFRGGETRIADVVVETAETDFLNTLQLSTVSLDQSTFVTNISNLHVGSLSVTGYINNVDLPSINKHVLRVSGDQEISEEYTFDYVHVNDAVRFNGRINNRALDDLIPITEGTYNIEQDVEFTEALSIENLTVRNRLNQIEIRNGKLDVLLTNSEDPQYVKGTKQFRNVDLLNSVHLQAQIKRKGLDALKPITMIEEALVLVGNFVVKGNVTIEKLLVTGDVKPIDGIRSLNDVEENALKITDEEVDFHAEFTQPITLGDIHVDLINGVDPKSLIVNGGGDEVVQYVKGRKQFLGDVYVTGATVLGRVNGADVSNLEAEVFTTSDDQEVIGKLHVRNLIVNKLRCANTKIGDSWWKDIVYPGNNQLIAGTTLIQNSLTIDELEVHSLNVEGLVNDYSFTQLINDAVRFDNQHEIKGHKSLRNLTVDHLEVLNGLDMTELSEAISRPEVVLQFEEDVTLPDDINVESVNIEGSINGLGSEDFKKSWAQKDEDLVFEEEYTFNTVVIYGKTYITSDYINQVKIEDLVVNTIKTDEPFEFDDVTFTNKITSRSPVILRGHISGLDLENTIVNCDNEQVIADLVTFKNDVSIEGTLSVDGLVNGLRLSDLCEFASPTVTEDPKNLIINGSVHFSKGPVFKRIDGVSFEDVLENAWISDRETELGGYVEFDDVVFQNDVHVEGFINEINLRFLADNYFSKSQNQSVSAHLDFTEGINFLDGVSASEARLYGRVFGIDLGAFIKTAILDDVDQIFDDALRLDTCNIQDMQGEYLVNDFNLHRDVMRYDADNIVTGRKAIPNVLTLALVIGDDVQVQDVNLANWIQRGVLKTGNHAITGRVSFDGNVTFSNGLGVIGLVNGYKFNKNSIMLYSQPQNITGKKTFLASPTVTFKMVELKGRINNVDLIQLVNEQSFKNSDTIYESPVSLDGGAWVKNLIVQKLYNGVNVEELVRNLTRFASLNNYYDDYANLLDASNKVRKSLRFQSYYLDYYKAVQVFENVKFVHALKSETAYDRLVMSRSVNGTSLIDFYVWDLKSGSFILDMSSIQIGSANYLSYVSTLEFSEKTYLFSEYFVEDNPEERNFLGNIFDVYNETTLEIIQQIPSNGTKFVKAFTMKKGQRNCVAVIYFDKDYTNVLCESEDDDGGNLLAIHQQLATTAPSEAVTLEITDSVYLLIMNVESEKREAHVDVWKSDTNTELFNLYQIIFTIAPKSIAATSYKGVYYLAIASGFLQNATFTGTVEIRRFDVTSGRFERMQDINLAAPTSVEFAVLPTEELVLYILSDSVTEPLIIYMYEGITGFVRKAAIATPMKFSHMCSFNTHTKDHFIVAQNKAEVHIIKAILKGHR